MTIKKSSAVSLQIVVALIAVGALTFLLWEPQVEGVNVGATNFEIYFQDPFLAYAYIAAIPFFVILYKAFKLLGDVGRNEVLGERSQKALRTIRNCALLSIGFVVGGVSWLMSMDIGEDRPPLIMMSTIVTLVFVGIAVVATKFERKVKMSQV